MDLQHRLYSDIKQLAFQLAVRNNIDHPFSVLKVSAGYEIPISEILHVPCVLNNLLRWLEMDAGAELSRLI